MISDSFTTITNGTMFDFLYTLDNALGGYFIFGILLALLIVLGLTLYGWSNDIVGSFLNSSYTVSILGFIFSLAKTTSGIRVFAFDKEIFFIVLTALLFVGKKVGD